MVKQYVRLLPQVAFTIADTTEEQQQWTLEAPVQARTNYAAIVDTAVRDVMGQRLTGNTAAGYTTPGAAPSISYAWGRVIVERTNYGTLTVQHVNVDTLIAIVAPVPDSLIPVALSRFGWTSDSLWMALRPKARLTRIPVRPVLDKPAFTRVKLPLADARKEASLFAVRVEGKAGRSVVGDGNPITLVQVTDLAVHAKIATQSGTVWVTSILDGTALAGVAVTLQDTRGRLVAAGTSDARGIARLGAFAAPRPAAADSARRQWYDDALEGYVVATRGADRAIVAIQPYDADLSPWRFNVGAAWGTQRAPVAGAVFTERGIYRPGERLYATAIVRDGLLGALRVPTRGDQVRWTVLDRERKAIRTVHVPLSAFGTAQLSFAVPASAAVGTYSLAVTVRRRGEWVELGSASYRVAEYRPPEFLVTVTNADTVAKYPGDSLRITVSGRYLFGAPMSGATLGWSALESPAWWFDIPGLGSWVVGDDYDYLEGDDADGAGEIGRGTTILEKTDSLDVRGERRIALELPAPRTGRPSAITVNLAVTDVNRQVSGGTASTLVHSSDFYIAVKPDENDYFWKAGAPEAVRVRTVRPDGSDVAGVAVDGVVVRREWHRIRRERDGITELIGEWVADTVGRCRVITGADSVSAPSCDVTPTAGGVYSLTFAAKDAQGRAATTRFARYVVGSDFVPWEDASQFKMSVIPDKKRYAVGDTATIMFAAPFVGAEAWVAVEREAVISQRRIRITSGTTTLKLPITESLVPNAYVSILMARGRSARPASFEDTGRPTIRVGYAELRVTPEVKRLHVALEPSTKEYRPGDTARVKIAVRGRGGSGEQSEVTLWAVDEGILALTGYRTPDPIDLLYRARGLGVRLASNVTTVAPQVPEGIKGQREPGGGGGSAGADVLRSRFQSTAFFLGSIVTDSLGNASAAARLPDNLTTFRVMAVAVSARDRYGSGETPLLVTRPLVARPALPRFVRPGDRFEAGTTINRRDGAAAPVSVRAQVSGAVTLTGPAVRQVTLPAARGMEVRFPFVAARGDSAVFRFDAGSGTVARDSDAVRLSVPVRPDHHPRSSVVSGILRDSVTVAVPLPPNLDRQQSTITVTLGASPRAVIEAMVRDLKLYLWDCTEQIASALVPTIALYRATGSTDAALRTDVARAVAVLSRRQNDNGGIGYWKADHWSTGWLTSYAAGALLDARDAGFPVDSAVLARIAEFLRTDLHKNSYAMMSPVAQWYALRHMRLRDQVASVDFLSRYGQADVPGENELVQNAALLAMEDRARLAEVLVRRKETATARKLLEPIWRATSVDGRVASLPDSVHTPFYFTSGLRPFARLLSATLAVEPAHPLVGPLIEAVAGRERASRPGARWNTADIGAAAAALAKIVDRQSTQGPQTVTVRAGGRTLVSRVQQGAAVSDTTVAVARTGGISADGTTLTLSLSSDRADGLSYYYVTLREIPTVAPVTPLETGIRVERWYEAYPGNQPITSVAEGDVVRVRLRVTVRAVRNFFVLDDPLPAGLEAIDLSLRTASVGAGPGSTMGAATNPDGDDTERSTWYYGSWDMGWWSPFDFREIRGDRVVYSATTLWPGTYTATYVARATTPGVFIRPPAHAEEMYNPGANGRSDGGVFTVTVRPPR